MKKLFDGNLEAFAIGHQWGLNPRGTIAAMIKENMKVNLSGMIEGFDQGRLDLIEFNGNEALESPPQHILSLNSMAEYMINGMFDIAVDETEFNETQLTFIREWVNFGKLQRDDDFLLTLLALLESNGIVVNK